MKKTLFLAFILLATVLVYGDYSSSGGSSSASDISCSDCVALGTETSGNYAASSSEGGPATSVENNSVDGTDIAMGSDAQGDILYYNGTDYARLGAGTAGQVLKTQGAAANPAWDSLAFSLDTVDLGYFFGTFIHIPSGSATNSTLSAANVVPCSQFILPWKSTVANISFTISTLAAGGLMDVGLYNAAGSKVISTGAQATDATGPFTVSITPVTLNPGVYYNCWTADNGTVAVVTINPTTGAPNQLNNQASDKVGHATNSSATGVLPATLGGISANTSSRCYPLVLYER